MTSSDQPSVTAERFDSAIDKWIIGILLLGPVVAAGAAVALLMMDRMGDAATLFFCGAFTLIATMAFAVPCRYTIDPEHIAVRCGLIYYRIPLNDVISVESSRTLRSGPALSLKRVVVSTKRKDHILSPMDRDAFINRVQNAIDERTRSRETTPGNSSINAHDD